MERRNIFSDRSNALHSLNSDEEEDGYDSPHVRRRGASVDEFLRGSELGRHVSLRNSNIFVLHKKTFLGRFGSAVRTKREPMLCNFSNASNRHFSLFMLYKSLQNVHSKRDIILY